MSHRLYFYAKYAPHLVIKLLLETFFDITKNISKQESFNNTKFRNMLQETMNTGAKKALKKHINIV